MQKRTAHNKLTQEQVIESFNKVHGEGTYGYDRVIYLDNLTPVEIYCNIHKEYFPQSPKNHKKGCTCPKCGRDRQIESARKTKEDFVKEAIEKYGDKDNYDKVEYVNNKTEVTITCPLHGDYVRT